jgi:hypothetical protein
VHPLARLVVCAVATIVFAGTLSRADASANFTAGSTVVAASTSDVDRSDSLTTIGHHPDEDPTEKAKAFERRARELAKKGDHEAAAKAYEQAAIYWKKAGEFKKADKALEKAEEMRKLAEQTE